MPPLSYLTGLCIAAAFCAGATEAFAQEVSQNEVNNPLTPKITLTLQDYYVGDLAGIQEGDANQLQPQGGDASASNGSASGSSGGGEANSSNNPLTPKTTIFLQNYYVPTTFGPTDRIADQFFVRGIVPFKVFGLQQLTRLTILLANVPVAPSGSDTGLGDIQLLNVTQMTIKGFGSVGVGPLFVFPSADSRALGQGKWQAGIAGIVISPQKWGLLGGLVTFAQSFAAAEAGRRSVSTLQFQPLVTRNLADGFYLRSTGTWTFDFATRTNVVPIGIGVGKVWKVSAGTVNAYFEPQYSIAHRGPGQAKWQLLAGLTVQFK